MRQKKVVGVLQTQEILAIITGLEQVEKQAQAIADHGMELHWSEEWVHAQSVGVSARSALMTFRAIVEPRPSDKQTWTIEWGPGGYAAALAALTGQPFPSGREVQAEYEEEE